MEKEAFEVCDGTEIISGERLRDYVLNEKKSEVNREELQNCYARHDMERKGYLTREEFLGFMNDLALIKERQTNYYISSTAAVGAGGGFLIGGPIGAALFGGLGAAYGALSSDWRNMQMSIAGAATLGLMIGPGGLLVGAALGGIGQSYGDQSYLGEPKTWNRFESKAHFGEMERLGDPYQDICNDQEESIEQKAKLSICCSGGGLRAATAFLAFLAELEDANILSRATHVATCSGSCWSLVALLESDEQNVKEFLPVFGQRLESDLRLPRSAWRSGVSDEKVKEAWIFNRFAARRNQGHVVGIADIWGAHLSASLLKDKPQGPGAYGLGALRNNQVFGQGITPIFTAVEAVNSGPVWSASTKCEICNSTFGIIIGKNRHHCRACGMSVCETCSVKEEQRRCKNCIANNQNALERTSWRWWEFTPHHVGPVTGTKTPSHIFGRRKSEDITKISSTGGEPVGQLLGVFGSAMCATIERYEAAGAISENTAFLARAIADPSTSDPGRSLLRPSSFHYGPEILADSFVFLGDAGFSSNLPLIPILYRGSDIVICLDSSGYTPLTLRTSIAREVARAINALQDIGCTRIHFDIDAYANDPVSFHTVRPPNKSSDSLLIILTLAKNMEDLDFDPLANAASGGFCANSSASYESADYNRLVSFVRHKVRSQIPLIKKRIEDFNKNQL